MQRWVLLLVAYDYRWVYHRRSEVGNADPISRFPLANETDVCDYVHLFSVADAVLLSSVDIQKGTRTDSVSSKVLMYTMHGWQACVTDSNLALFFTRLHALFEDQQCVTWRN